MFGALNRFISRLDGEPQQRVLQGAGGFQVLQNNNKELALEPWFDFIIGINGRTLVGAQTTNPVDCCSLCKDNNDPNLFAMEVRNCAGSTMSLGVWSAKVTCSTRARAMISE
jgi:hypothetical protein